MMPMMARTSSRLSSDMPESLSFFSPEVGLNSPMSIHLFYSLSCGQPLSAQYDQGDANHFRSYFSGGAGLAELIHDKYIGYRSEERRVGKEWRSRRTRLE